MQSAARSRHNARVVKRSKFDWVLEGVALLAVLATVVGVSIYAPRLLPVLRRSAGLAPRTTLLCVAAIDIATYAVLTWRAQRLFDIPAELERRAPQLRAMLFSLAIAMKTVLTLFAAYLVWALINIGLRRGSGISSSFLTLFTLAVPLPLTIYTVKIRKYR
jgi:hypothetical protein